MDCLQILKFCLSRVEDIHKTVCCMFASQVLVYDPVLSNVTSRHRLGRSALGYLVGCSLVQYREAYEENHNHFVSQYTYLVYGVQELPPEGVEATRVQLPVILDRNKTVIFVILLFERLFFKIVYIVYKE